MRDQVNKRLDELGIDYIIINDSDVEFARCDITNMYSDCLAMIGVCPKGNEYDLYIASNIAVSLVNDDWD